jgi:hypothetical protein
MRITEMSDEEFVEVVNTILGTEEGQNVVSSWASKRVFLKPEEEEGSARICLQQGRRIEWVRRLMVLKSQNRRFGNLHGIGCSLSTGQQLAENRCPTARNTYLGLAQKLFAGHSHSYK